MQDTITIGSIAGLIGTALMTFYHWMLRLIGFKFIDPWETAANIILNRNLVHTPIGYLIGFLGQFILGSIFGITVAYTLRLTGKDFFWLKGVGVGALIWLGSVGLLMKLLQLELHGRSQPLTNLLTIIDFIVLGTVSSIIITRYARFKKAK
jgi:hypothetical protein